MRRALYSLTEKRAPCRTAPCRTALPPLPPSQGALPPRLWFFRSHATLQSIQKGHHRRLLFSALKTKQDIRLNPKKASNPREKLLRQDALARAHNRTRARGESSTDLDKQMRYELQFLTDPLKLASAVLDKLRNNEIDSALSLVRASEKGRDGRPVDNLVSWNHIIDWLMSQGNPSESWRVYNEVCNPAGHVPSPY